MRHRSRGARLVEKARARLGLGERLGAQQLDRHAPLQLLVLGAIDDAHAAATDDVDEPKVGDARAAEILDDAPAPGHRRR